LLERIKPSRYDDGYVMQRHRVFNPSNSESAVYGITLDAIDEQGRESRFLGTDDIERLRLYLYYRRLRRMRMEVLAEPGIENYTDMAIAPVSDDDTESLEMFQVSDAARSAVKKAKNLSRIIEKARAEIPVRVSSAAR